MFRKRGADNLNNRYADSQAEYSLLACYTDDTVQDIDNIQSNARSRDSRQNPFAPIGTQEFCWLRLIRINSCETSPF